MPTLNFRKTWHSVVFSLIAAITFGAQAEVYMRQENGVILLSNIKPAEPANSALKEVKPAAQVRELTSAIAPSFPRISKSEQTDRDLERRRILQSEYADENRLYQLATAQNASAETINRHLANLASLRREILAISSH